MRLIAFKIIIGIALFLIVQATILPWAMSNDILPLWLDVLIVSSLMMIALMVVDKCIKKVAPLLNKERN